MYNATLTLLSYQNHVPGKRLHDMSPFFRVHFNVSVLWKLYSHTEAKITARFFGTRFAHRFARGNVPSFYDSRVCPPFFDHGAPEEGVLLAQTAPF